MTLNPQNKNWFNSSIKFRIIAVVGIVISLLMIVITIGVLIQWRNLVINQQTESAVSFARSFSIPITEILINRESDPGFGGDILETHIQNFLENVDNVLYLSIQDNNNRIIAHNRLEEYGNIITDPALLSVVGSTETISRIFREETDKWVFEVFHPLQIGEKRWGSLVIGFDNTQTYNQIRASFYLLLFLALSAIIITLAILYFLINRILSSLKEFVAEIDKVDLDYISPTRLKPRNDEIGYLIEHFEMLKQRLKDSKVELENVQNQIFQAEKLASIGRLASGVAHEVNNPLNGMHFCVYGIQNDIDNKQQTKEYLNLIDEGLTQIESVVTKLLGYSRQTKASKEELDLGKEIKIVLDLLDYRIKEKNVQVTCSMPDQLSGIKADPNLIREMLMNLLLNSLDAVDKEGEIKVTVHLNEEGDCVISIRDNGIGIEATEMEKIFEPFYTTKDTGKGTGLGLSVTHGIIDSHGGTIEVKSEPGVYTEFIITLPRKDYGYINS